MRKATHYKVSGVLENKPADLPEGLAVEEVEVELPLLSIDIVPIHGFGEVKFVEYPLIGTRGRGIRIESKGIFQESEVRKLRDFLNVVLGEDKFVGRVLVDSVKDVWFEFEPNVWTQGNDLDDVHPNPFERAKARLSEDSSFSEGLTRKSLQTIKENYGPVRFIENTWE